MMPVDNNMMYCSLLLQHPMPMEMMAYKWGWKMMQKNVNFEDIEGNWFGIPIT